MKRSNSLILFHFLLIFLISCQQRSNPVVRNQQDFKKIDFHTHYRYDRECLEPLLDRWNMKAVLVDVARMDTNSNKEQWEAIKVQYNKYPDRYILCASFAALDIDEPDFAERTIEKLRKDIVAGAKMVKVWKVHGMEIKDNSGNFIQIDDPRIQPVWDFIAENNIPVLAHIGEPRAAWLPLDEKSPHYNYYKNNPQYHAYLHPEIPSWETIIAARDHWIEQNPGLTIIAAHMGSMAYDVNMIAERLEKYPNMYVEPAARFGDLTSQNSESVRDFIIKYQDRILYGTDLGFSSPENEEDPEDCSYTDTIYSYHWRYLTESDSIYYDSPMISFPVKTKGLNLPDSILRKLYYENAAMILGFID